MKIAIYDEKKEFTDNFYEILKKICEKEDIIINKFIEHKKLLNSIKKEKYEIIFMDADKNFFINKGNKLLINLLAEIKLINQNIQILFFSLCKRKIFQENEFKNLDRSNNKDFLVIQKKNNYKIININEILYFKYKKKYITLVTKNKEIEFLSNIEYLENIFKKNFFVKCGKNFLINPVHIYNITERFIYLRNDCKILLNTVMYKEIEKNFNLYLINKYGANQNKF